MCLDNGWKPDKSFTLKFAAKLLLKIEIFAVFKFLKNPPSYVVVAIALLSFPVFSGARWHDRCTTCAVIIQLCHSHVDSVTPFCSMILSCQRSPYLIKIQLRWRFVDYFIGIHRESRGLKLTNGTSLYNKQRKHKDTKVKDRESRNEEFWYTWTWISDSSVEERTITIRTQ